MSLNFPAPYHFYGIAQCIWIGHVWSSLYAWVDMFFFNKFDRQFLFLVALLALPLYLWQPTSFLCGWGVAESVVLTFIVIGSAVLFIFIITGSPVLFTFIVFSALTTIGSAVLFTTVFLLIHMTLLMQMTLCNNIWCNVLFLLKR